MAKEDFQKLGFDTREEYERIRSQAPVLEGKKEGDFCRLADLSSYASSPCCCHSFPGAITIHAIAIERCSGRKDRRTRVLQENSVWNLKIPTESSVCHIPSITLLSLVHEHE